MNVSAYRMVKRKYARGAFDGEGARRYGGRWNSKGISCVYAASSISLALLEILVHVEDSSILRLYEVYEIQLPEKHIHRLDAASLPENWRSPTAPSATVATGDEWLNRRQPQLALAVPSVIVPRESNYLLNMIHPDFKPLVAKARKLDFELDSRPG